MGKQVKIGEKTDLADQKVESKTKKPKKSKRTRKSDAVVNDISSLLSSNLCVVSPSNNKSNSEKKKTSGDDAQNNKSGRKSNTLSRNVSSSSLDGFVVRTPKKTQKVSDKNQSDQCKKKSNDKITEILFSDNEFDLKENKKDVVEKGRKKKRKDLRKINENDKQKYNKTYFALNGSPQKQGENQSNIEKRTDDESKDVVDLEKVSTPQEKKNAFQFMMDNRNRSIGTNSPGKELKIKDVLKDKEKLTARRSLLQNWADIKGGIKRKNEEVERDECITFKMDERAKRLKKLLNASDISKGENTVPTNKNRVIGIDSDMENSEDSYKDDSQDPRNNQGRSKNLDGFLAMLNKKKSENVVHVYDSDNERPQEVLKIKMFSPEVFKRKKQKRTLSEDGTITPPKSKSSRSKKSRKALHSLYSENSDASNDSDTFVLRRSARRSVRNAKFFFVSENEDSNDNIIDVDEIEKEKKLKNPAKVAPVFLLSRPKIDPKVLEAKKKFLNSGIPDSLKKAIEKEKACELDFDVFPKISHIQQRIPYQSPIDFWNLPDVQLNLKCCENSLPKLTKLRQGSLTNLSSRKIGLPLTTSKPVTNLKGILQKIAEDNPDYPVVKCFRVLNEKAKAFERKVAKRKRRKIKAGKAPANYEMWTEKYKAMSHDDFIGNHKRVFELKTWLEKWSEYINDAQGKNQKLYNSDSEFDIDSSSYDNAQGLCNAMVLIGPHGSGKSISVHTLCSELGINVIELNASSKRTGKRLLQELQEATQSHQVRKTKALSNFLNTKKETSERKLCLLLIEDLDIVFDQDDGFISALSQLLLTSKRPIVITTTDISCSHLQRFVLQYPIIKFSALSSKMLSVWFQILCLLEGVVVDSDDLGQLLEFYNGDARRTLLQLQLFIQSGGSLYREVGTKEDSESDSENFVHKNCIYNFLDKDCLVNDLNLEKVWWNLPIILDVETSLEKCSDVSDTLGVIDIIYTKSNIFERHSNSIDNQRFLKDSVELKEQQGSYLNHEFIRNWSNTLLNNVINSYTETGKFEFDKPTSGQKRWLNKQRDCSEKFSKLVPFSYHIDRRSYALDYYPTLRAISRSEAHRASVNVKRKNRFYNYLRAFDFKCSDSTNEVACKIFSVKGEDEM